MTFDVMPINGDHATSRTGSVCPRSFVSISQGLDGEPMHFRMWMKVSPAATANRKTERLSFVFGRKEHHETALHPRRQTMIC